MSVHDSVHAPSFGPIRIDGDESEKARIEALTFPRTPLGYNEVVDVIDLESPQSPRQEKCGRGGFKAVNGVEE